MRWILDGYNIIHSDVALAKMARNCLETGRDELIRMILLATRFKGEEIFLVFDGTSGSQDLKVAPGFRVIFSKSPESADDLIKRMTGNYLKRRSILVVSNDRSIIDYTKECGAKTVSSKDFLSLIRTKGVRRGEKSSSEKPPLSSNPDLELLKLFKDEKHET